MRIAVIGGAGQLGTDLRRRLEGEVRVFDLPGLDVQQADSVASALTQASPNVVINCAAMTDVDGCEEEAETAFRVNALGACHVARCAQEVGAAAVYVSSDYVFGRQEQRTRPYSEQDLPGPVNVYGASKLAGEHLTRAYCDRCYIVRTCGLYGLAGARGKGGNFVQTILRRAREGNALRVVCDQRVSPTSTWELAGKISALIGTGAYGLYHLAAVDQCTWHEFARAILAHEGLGVEMQAIRSDECHAKARRPALSALASLRLTQIGLTPCRTWREMLHEYLQTCRPAASSTASG